MGTLSYTLWETETGTAMEPALPEGLTFDAPSRTIAGTPTATMAAKGYTYTVTDEGEKTASLTFEIIVGAALSFGDATIEDQSWVANTAISPLTLPEATGGTGTLTYELRPTLPDDLVFNKDTRTISGTPKAAADNLYVYAVSDESDTVVELEFTIAVTAASSQISADDRAQQAALAAIGGGVLDGLIGAVSERADGGGDAPLALGGHTATAGGGVPSVGFASDATRSQGLTWDEMLAGTRFTVTAGDGPASVTFWGKGETRSFAPLTGAAGGGLRTAFLGADTQVGERLRLGFALSRSEGEAAYAVGGAAGNGRIEAAFTTVTPYLSWRPDASTLLWSAVGTGDGSIRNLEDAASTVVDDQGDLRVALGAAGARRTVAEVGPVSVTAFGDAGFVRMTAEGRGTLAGLTSQVRRARAGVEGAAAAPLGGGQLAGKAMLAARQDGGDGLTGIGQEVSTELRFTLGRSRLEATGRLLSLRSDDRGDPVLARMYRNLDLDGYRETGARLTAAYDPAANGAGLSLELMSSRGTVGGADAGRSLWRNDALTGGLGAAAADDDDGWSWRAKIGYGFAGGDLPVPGVLTPYALFERKDEANREMRAGLNFMGGELRGVRPTLGLAGGVREQTAGDGGFMELTARARF